MFGMTCSFWSGQSGFCNPPKNTVFKISHGQFCDRYDWLLYGTTISLPRVDGCAPISTLVFLPPLRARARRSECARLSQVWKRKPIVLIWNKFLLIRFRCIKKRKKISPLQRQKLIIVVRCKHLFDFVYGPLIFHSLPHGHGFVLS